jgi:1,4-alpha-glucan branching enzyme
LVIVAGCASVKTVEKEVHYTTPVETGPKEVEGGILFQFEAPTADQVNVAGSFNDWGGTLHGAFDASIDPMEKSSSGIWQIVIPLEPGLYQYKFVVNNGEAWREDPHNPEKVDDGYGGYNSVLLVE